MLTKEFSAKVGLSEKQVRKIVQHLEDRGYQLSKTEYRGREATDFQEEDIELFQEIAEKVKETNSYDQAFETLEQEKDFLQVLVKDEASHQSPELQQLIEELRLEVQHMRRERQMLGEMLQQVHIQQQKLEQTLALQAPQQEDSIQGTETSAKSTTDNKADTAAVNSQSDNMSNAQTTTASTTEVETEDATNTVSETKVTEEKPAEDKAVTAKEDATSEIKPETSVEDKVEETTEEKTTDQSTVETSTTETPASTSESTSATTEDKETVDSITKEETVDTTSTEASNISTDKTTEEEPKKKGFFQRLFNI